MPIRHCQKCGLKVLIDESQAGANPFYCQRCTTAMKGPDSAGDDLLSAAAAPPPLKRTPVPAPAAVAVAPPKSATVKVLCPYCKASFNGRTPQKPAKGSCPVCQKELVLLPDGSIRAAAGFNLDEYHAGGTPAPAPEPEAPPPAPPPVDRTPSPVRPAPKKAPPPPPEPDPSAETDTSGGAAPLPSWLDDGAEAKPAPVPQPETDVAIDAVSAPPPEEAAPRLEDLPPPPKPAPRARPAPAPAPSAASTASSPAVPDPVPISSSNLRKPMPVRATDRRVASVPPPAESAGATGTGLVIVALLLVLAPLGAAGGMLAAREKLAAQSFVASFGARFAKGLKKVHEKLFPPADATTPMPVEPPKSSEPRPEEPARPTAEDRKRDEEEINKRWMEFKREERTFRQKSVGATAAEKAEYQKVEDDLRKKQTHIQELRGRYQRTYGKDYNPQDQ